MDETENAQIGRAELQQRLAGLPSILAIPLSEFASEAHPVMQLHRLCEAVEILTRFCTVVALGELRVRLGDEPLPPELLKELQPQIERPTFGKWKNMLAAIAKILHQSEPVVVGEMRDFVAQHLLPALPGGDEPPPETCLIKLRNNLVHGGPITKKEPGNTSRRTALRATFCAELPAE